MMLDGQFTTVLGPRSENMELAYYVSMNQQFSDGSNHEATVSITRNFVGPWTDPCQLMGDRDDHLQKIRCLRGNMS